MKSPYKDRDILIGLLMLGGLFLSYGLLAFGGPTVATVVTVEGASGKLSQITEKVASGEGGTATFGDVFGKLRTYVKKTDLAVNLESIYYP